MRLEVGTVRAACEAALLATMAACGYGLFTERQWGGGLTALSLCAVHFAATYLVTVFSFAAFARSRRTDMVRIVILVALLAEIVRFLLAGGFGLLDLASDAAGAFAVLVPSFLERFRSLVRSDPKETFSMVYPNDRRRRSRTVSIASRSSSAR
jgi:hypothetical protein